MNTICGTCGAVIAAGSTHTCNVRPVQTFFVFKK